jgi:hypothetical protein
MNRIFPVEERDERMIVLRSRQNGAETVGVFLVQPVDSRRSVIRGVLKGAAQEAERMAVLRHHNWRLSKLRDEMEHRAEREPLPPALEPAYDQAIGNLCNHLRECSLRLRHPQ